MARGHCSAFCHPDISKKEVSTPLFSFSSCSTEHEGKEARMLWDMPSLLSRHTKEKSVMAQVQQQPRMISIGNRSVLVEDEEFVQAYDAGYEAYYRYHRQDDVIDSSILLFQLRNGWNERCSDMENTGYIMGWLAAFYEQEEGQLARSVCVNLGDANTDSIRQAS